MPTDPTEPRPHQHPALHGGVATGAPWRARGRGEGQGPPRPQAGEPRCVHFELRLPAFSRAPSPHFPVASEDGPARQMCRTLTLLSSRN